MTENLRTLLGRWKARGYIDNSTYKNLNVTDGILPRAYGLPKIHKAGYPLRIIIFSINSPLYKLAIYFHNIINKSINHPNTHVKNSFELVKKLKSLTFETNVQIASFDVVERRNMKDSSLLQNIMKTIVLISST